MIGLASDKNINEPTRDSVTRDFHGTAALVGSLVCFHFGTEPKLFLVRVLIKLVFHGNALKGFEKNLYLFLPGSTCCSHNGRMCNLPGIRSYSSAVSSARRIWVFDAALV